MNAEAKVHLRTMHDLLVLRGREYDKHGFSDRYWEITDEYEAAKKAYWRAKGGA